jgi:hypothetical protein
MRLEVLNMGDKSPKKREEKKKKADKNKIAPITTTPSTIKPK